EAGEAYILEVNPNPDLTDGAAFMQCAVASGRSFGQTLGEIIELAMARARADGEDAPAEVDAGLPSDLLMREWVLRRGDGAGAEPPAEEVLVVASGVAAGVSSDSD